MYWHRWTFCTQHSSTTYFHDTIHLIQLIVLVALVIAFTMYQWQSRNKLSQLPPNVNRVKFTQANKILLVNNKRKRIKCFDMVLIVDTKNKSFKMQQILSIVYRIFAKLYFVFLWSKWNRKGWKDENHLTFFVLCSIPMRKCHLMELRRQHSSDIRLCHFQSYLDRNDLFWFVQNVVAIAN